MSLIGPRPAPRHQQQRGYTLIEILVAAVVLTGGLIGLASMQATGTRLNNGAYLRSQASIQAYDIIDRMRANRAAVLNGDYDIAFADTAPTTPTVPADIDLFLWRTNLDYFLPVGNGEITTTAGVTPDQPVRVTVTVQWSDDRDTGALTDFVVTTDL